MKRPFLLAALLLAVLSASAAAECTSINYGIKAFYPAQWQFAAYGCDEEIRTDSLLTGAARNQISSFSVMIRMDANRTDNPACKISDFVSGVGFTKTWIVDAHGSGSGVTLSYFLNTAARDLAFNALPAQWRNNGWVEKRDGDPAPRIYFHGYGIQNLVTPALDTEAIIGALWCESGFTRSFWGIPPNGITGRSMYAYDISCPVEAGCEDVEQIIRNLGCFRSPLIDGRVDAAAYGTSSDLKLYGNRTNYINCATGGCAPWAARFISAAAFAGSFHWATFGEQDESHYLVKGYRQRGSAAELIADVPGRGTDGFSKVRTYDLAVNPDYQFGEIVEVDNNGVETRSRAFSWGAKPAKWDMLVSLDDQSIPVAEGPANAAASYNAWSPPAASLSRAESVLSAIDDDCADVVVYSSRSYLIAPQYIQAAGYSTAQGFPNKVRGFYGTKDLASVKQALADVVAANQQYNNSCPSCPRRYPSDPMLIIVGTPAIVNYQTFANDQWHTCTQPMCKSYALVGDLDSDGVQDCPVSVVPADTLFEAERSAEFADDWNNNQFVADASAVFFAGDGNGSSTNAQYMLDELDDVANVYRASGKEVLGVKSEFAYSGDFDQMWVDGASLVNQGVRDVWLQGLTTGIDDLTGFLGAGQRFDPAVLTTKQRIAVFAPSCETSAIWWGNIWGAPLCTDLLFNETEHTSAAVFVGQLNAAFGSAHREFLQVLKNEISNVAGQRIPYATIVRNAVRTMNEQYPGYGKGVVTFGSYVLSPGDISTVGVGEPKETAETVRLWAVARPGQTELHFNLPSDAEVALNIFDIAGRRVSVVRNDRLSAGSYTFSWFHQAVSSGVYFATLRVAGHSLPLTTKSQKLVLVR